MPVLVAIHDQMIHGLTVVIVEFRCYLNPTKLQTDEGYTQKSEILVIGKMPLD